MSHFSNVQTQIIDAECLIEALADLGYSELEIEPNLALYGYQGDARPERADIVIRRRHIGRLSNDIGFHLESDGTYQIIISDYDKSRKPRFVEEVTQRYAYHLVQQQAQAQGFSVVEEEQQQDGSIRLVCQQWR